MSRPESTEVEELRELIALAGVADEVLETCLTQRLSLRASLSRFLPAVAQRLGASGAAVITTDEELNRASFTWGALPDADAWTLLSARPAGIHLIEGQTLVCQVLDVAGVEVGLAGFAFAGERGDAAALVARVRCVCEELDGLLAQVHTASVKQDLIERINRALSNRVFERGLDEAVSLLFQSIGLRAYLLIWRDPVNEQFIYYRLYREGRLEFDNDARRHPGLEAAISTHGLELLSPERLRLQTTLGVEGGVESVLTSGTTRADWLGKTLAQPGPGGFSTFALDLVRLLAEMSRDRLIDHNRERRYLAQSFSAPVIKALLREPGYERLLQPREEPVAILFADINSFTSICEQVLVKPSVIGQFVDRWSRGAVDLIWKHGGTFDKMIGDCVIGLFGPPFYRDTPEARALGAVRAAREILDFTVGFGDDPLLAAFREHPELTGGLGVAVGVNLCPACVGTFGPNRDMTAFSSGMNATARLQGLAGFREILAMKSVVDALQRLPGAEDLRFGPLAETAVKNVLKPLRFARLQTGGQVTARPATA